jgi:oligopeptidase A
VLSDVVASSLQIRQSQPIYRGLKEIREGALWQSLSPSEQRAVHWNLRHAEEAGVGLAPQQRGRFNEIETQLSQLGTDFANHVLDSTREFSLTLRDEKDMAGWPESLRQLAAQSYNSARGSEEGPSASAAQGPWRITLDPPSFVPFLQHHRNGKQRAQVFRAYYARASSGEHDNQPIIQRTLQLRQEKAQLLGYENYAQLSLATKMAPDVTAVSRMFHELELAARPHAAADLEDLQEYVRQQGQDSNLAHWDLAFWAERLRESRYEFTDDEVRPYFSMPRVLQGLFDLAERLFDVRVVSADGTMPVWHQDVHCYRVQNREGKELASFYLDPYSRPEEKRGGAWMATCLQRVEEDGRWRNPVVHICCNSSPPLGDQPSQLSFREVETLFHEFGHGLQGMLTTAAHPDVAGTSGIERDAIELPSQFMENWCYDEPTLIGMTAHVETNEPLPRELFAKISDARNYRAGSLMLRQLEFGMTDMELHDRFEPNSAESAFDVHRRVEERMSSLPPLQDNFFLCSFQHIFAGGYAAGYYVYKWAEVLSADAFAAFEEAGLQHADAIQAMGRRFRDTVLCKGGSQHPMEVFLEFRGREPTTAALLRHNGLQSGS